MNHLLHMPQLVRYASTTTTLSPQSTYIDDHGDLDELDSIASSPPFGAGHHDNLDAKIKDTYDLLVDIHDVQITPIDVSKLLVSIARIIRSMLTNGKILHVIVRMSELQRDKLDSVVRNNAAEPFYGSEEAAGNRLTKLGGQKKAVAATDCDIAVNLMRDDWNVVWFNISNTNLVNYENSNVFTVVNFNFLPGSGWDRLPGALNDPTRALEALVYIDWENINVELQMVTRLINGIRSEIKRTFPKVLKPNFNLFHGTALKERDSDALRDKLPQYITMTKISSQKRNAVDDAIKDSMDMEFAHTELAIHDCTRAIVMVSGDQDFSSKLVRLARLGVPILLICNHMTNDAYRYNAHFNKSILYDELEKLEVLQHRRDHQELRSGKDKRTCVFFNSSVPCKHGSKCAFDHSCYCGSKDHKISYHSMRRKIMQLPCKDWNLDRCTNPCPHGKMHLCFTCLSPDHTDHEPHPCKQTYSCRAPTCKDKVFRTRIEFEDHLANYRHGTATGVSKK